jgi:hypothetical protein
MNQFNEQFAKTTGQFADVAANVNRLALQNAEKAFGLQLAAFEDSAHAAFAFFGELAEVRDLDGLKTVLPKGAQVARANAERGMGVAQEVFANSVKTGEAIGALAKGQFEQATAQAKAEVEKVAKAASKAK